MDWTQVLALMGAIFIANMGVMIPMFLWLRSEGNSDRREMVQIMRTFHDDIQKQMNDFHTRLSVIDVEFRGIMAKQDADFKNHMMYLHGDKK